MWFDDDTVEVSYGLDWIQVRISAKSTYCQDLIFSINFVEMGGMPSDSTADVPLLGRLSSGGSHFFLTGMALLLLPDRH